MKGWFTRNFKKLSRKLRIWRVEANPLSKKAHVDLAKINYQVGQLLKSIEPSMLVAIGGMSPSTTDEIIKRCNKTDGQLLDDTLSDIAKLCQILDDYFDVKPCKSSLSYPGFADDLALIEGSNDK